MRSRTKISTLFVVLALGAGGNLHAQDFTRQMSRFIGQNARSFVQPVADGFMGDLNAGVVVVSAHAGWHIGGQLVLAAAIVHDDQRTFRSSPFNETVEFQYNGIPFLGDLEIPPTVLPTAVGLSNAASFTGHLKRIRPKGLPYVPGQYDFISRDASITIGGSSDVPIIPMFAPEVTVSSPWGTVLMVRFLPITNLGSVGSLGVFGIGLSHEIGQYISLPFEVLVQAHYGSLQMKGTDSDINFNIDATGYAVQLQTMKLWGSGIVHGGPYVVLGLESSEATIGYAFADPYLGKQSLSFENGIQGRFTLGGQLCVSVFSVSGGYGILPVSSFEVSVGIAYDF